MCKLIENSNLQVEEGTALNKRLILSSVYQLIQEATTTADLERVITTVDSFCSEENSGLEKWAHFRPTVVAQILVGMLRAEVGTEPISAKAVVVNEEMLSALDADKWKKAVGSLFRHYSYGLLEEEEEKAGDDEGCFASTQQQVTDFENLKVQEGLADIGAPSKVNVLYIFKQWGWAAFVNQFEDFLRDLHIEVLGVPELVTQYQSIHPQREVAPTIQGGGNSEPASQLSLLAEGSDGGDEKNEEANEVVEKGVGGCYDGGDEKNEEANEVVEKGVDGCYEDGDETDEEGPETQPESKQARHRLKEATSNLTQTVKARVDPLANALAETSPVARSVMASTALQKENRSTGHGVNTSQAATSTHLSQPKPAGPFVGKRSSSVAVTFESSQDSLVSPNGFEERLSLPAHSSAPSSFVPTALLPTANGGNASGVVGHSWVPGEIPTRKVDTAKQTYATYLLHFHAALPP